MALPLILAGLQVAGGIAGAVQGNQQRQKAKGEIGRAYELGTRRLALRQGDVRQGVGESLVARGLAQGGNRRLSTAPETRGTRTMVRGTALGKPIPVVAPVTQRPVTGARDLGGQAMTDLAREQQLERTALKQQRDSAVAGADAAATGALVGGIGQAVAGGIQGYQTGTMYNSFAGIDPVDPLRRGAWAQPAVDAFNLYNRQG